MRQYARQRGLTLIMLLTGCVLGIAGVLLSIFIPWINRWRERRRRRQGGHWHSKRKINSEPALVSEPAVATDPAADFELPFENQPPFEWEEARPQLEKAG